MVKGEGDPRLGDIGKVANDGDGGVRRVDGLNAVVALLLGGEN